MFVLDCLCEPLQIWHCILLDGLYWWNRSQPLWEWAEFWTQYFIIWGEHITLNLRVISLLWHCKPMVFTNSVNTALITGEPRFSFSSGSCYTNCKEKLRTTKESHKSWCLNHLHGWLCAGLHTKQPRSVNLWYSCGVSVTPWAKKRKVKTCNDS